MFFTWVTIFGKKFGLYFTASAIVRQWFFVHVYFTNIVIIVSIVEQWQEALTDWLTCTYMIIHHFVKSTFEWHEYFSSVSNIWSIILIFARCKTSEIYFSIEYHMNDCLKFIKYVSNYLNKLLMFECISLREKYVSRLFHK